MGVEQENTDQRSVYRRLEDLSTNFVSSVSSVEELSERCARASTCQIVACLSAADWISDSNTC